MTTIFCDIDGTLVHQSTKIPYDRNTIALPGVIKRTYEWAQNDYTIILTTGRKESERAKTVRQLDELGILYDKLMSCTKPLTIFCTSVVFFLKSVNCYTWVYNVFTPHQYFLVYVPFIRISH